MNIKHIRQILVEICKMDTASPVVIGVSGGPDSLCLLDVLHSIGLPVIVAHFDHHLRPESGQDAAVVQHEAERLGVPCRVGGAQVADWANEQRLSLEEAARELRYRFLFEQARQSVAQAVAVGHTADDQVETVLMHLLRGSGLSGLTGMSFSSQMPVWDAQIPLVRPLLECWRNETVTYCQERQLPFVTDASNQSTAFYRNRIRLELIPELMTYNPQVKQALWRLTRVIEGDQALVEAAVLSAWNECTEGRQIVPGCERLNLARVRRQPEAVVRGLLRHAVRQIQPSLSDLGFEDIERGVAFIQHPSKSRQIDWLQGLRLLIDVGAGGQEDLVLVSSEVKEGDPLRLDFPWMDAGRVIPLPIPGEWAVQPGWVLSAGWEEPVDLTSFQKQARSFPWDAWLDADTLAPGALYVRRARPGERFQPVGMEGHSVKLSDFWINSRIPRLARAGWPLVCCGDAIAWIPGLRPAHPYRLTANTRRVIHFALHRVSP